MSEITHMFHFDSNDQLPMLVFFLLGAGFIAYHFISSLIHSYAQHHFHDSGQSTRYAYHIQRIVGFVFLGLIPAAFVVTFQDKSLTDFGFNVEDLPLILLWSGILGAVIIAANFYVARRPENLDVYPQIRLRNWNAKELTLNFLTWFIYLLGYEFMFRGLFLFSFYYAYGAAMAITVNCIMYALVHVPKGAKETIGSLPLGIILSIICLYTESFFVAFVFHIIMAFSNDLFAIKANPMMAIKNR